MIYFDNASTYYFKKNKILNFFNKISKKYFANSSSNHFLGYSINKKLDETRNKILKILNLNNDYEVIFNSCATEGINHAIKGYALKNHNRGNEIIVFQNEHSAVLETIKELKNFNFKIKYISCDKNGEINYKELEEKINNNTIMVIVMAVNNEVGAINDLQKIHNIINKYHKCVFFCDATQAIGKINNDYKFTDMLTFSSHKFGGLIGSGVLIKKKKIILEKLIFGGPQENNYRSGTVPAPLILTNSYILSKIMKKIKKNFLYVNKLKETLINNLKKINNVVINSYNNFPYIVNFSLKDKKASVIIESLSNKKIFVSSLSACNSKKNIVSYVLLNMGKNKQIAENSIRISFSSENTINEVKKFILEFKKIIKNIK